MAFLGNIGQQGNKVIVCVLFTMWYKYINELETESKTGKHMHLIVKVVTWL